MKEVLFISGNSDKVKEVRDMLGKWDISVKDKALDVDEIQDKDAEKVATRKVKKVSELLKVPLFVEDTGLYIDAMKGYPGTLIKHFLNSIGLQGIVDFVRDKDRTAHAVTVFAYSDGKGEVKLFEGRIDGTISDDVKEGDAFEWDKIFIPEGHDKTYSELGMEQKNKISHRSKAVRKLAEWLNDK